MPRCECCELLESSCGKAKQAQLDKELKDYRTKLRQRGWFVAQWPGVCDRCGEDFDAGTMIQAIRYGQGRYVGECCGPGGYDG